MNSVRRCGSRRRYRGSGIQLPRIQCSTSVGFGVQDPPDYALGRRGKDESGVRYVKRNAIAGHRFESWEGLQAHLAWWQREIADRRCHGTTGEVPLRPIRAGGGTLAPARGPDRRSGSCGTCSGRFHADCAVVVDTVVGGPRPAAIGAVRSKPALRMAGRIDGSLGRGH